MSSPSQAPHGGTINEQIHAIATAGPTKAREDGALLRLRLETIGPHPDQPRTTIDEARLKELMAGIVKAGGLLAPIGVRPALPQERKPEEPEYEYRLVAGQRRLEAYRRLLAAATSPAEVERYSTIPAVLKLGTDEADALRDALIENIHREDLSPLDAAEALASLKKKMALRTAREVAAEVGMKEDRVKRLLRLNDAPQVVKDAVRKGLTVTAQEVTAEPGGEGAPRERRETLRRLDLMEALLFAQLYDYCFDKHGGYGKASAAPRASQIVRNAIEHALRDGWSFRRIEEHVAAARAGKAPPTEGAAPKPPAFKSDAKQLVVYRQRLAGASTEAKAELASILAALLQELAPKPGATLPRAPFQAPFQAPE